jgi:hypothetical protein
MATPSKSVIIDLWDNGGRTADRYTIAISGVQEVDGKAYTIFLGASSDPFHPQGFGQHSHDIPTREYVGNMRIQRHRNLGKRITWAMLPDKVKQFVIGAITPEPEKEG